MSRKQETVQVILDGIQTSADEAERQKQLDLASYVYARALRDPEIGWYALKEFEPLKEAANSFGPFENAQALGQVIKEPFVTAATAQKRGDGIGEVASAAYQLKNDPLIIVKNLASEVSPYLKNPGLKIVENATERLLAMSEAPLRLVQHETGILSVKEREHLAEIYDLPYQQRMLALRKIDINDAATMAGMVGITKLAPNAPTSLRVVVGELVDDADAVMKNLPRVSPPYDPAVVDGEFRAPPQVAMTEKPKPAANMSPVDSNVRPETMSKVDGIQLKLKHLLDSTEYNNEPVRLFAAKMHAIVTKIPGVDTAVVNGMTGPELWRYATEYANALEQKMQAARQVKDAQALTQLDRMVTHWHDAIPEHYGHKLNAKLLDVKQGIDFFVSGQDARNGPMLAKLDAANKQARQEGVMNPQMLDAVDGGDLVGKIDISGDMKRAQQQNLLAGPTPEEYKQWLQSKVGHSGALPVDIGNLDYAIFQLDNVDRNLVTMREEYAAIERSRSDSQGGTLRRNEADMPYTRLMQLRNGLINAMDVASPDTTQQHELMSTPALLDRMSELSVARREKLDTLLTRVYVEDDNLRKEEINPPQSKEKGEIGTQWLQRLEYASSSSDGYASNFASFASRALFDLQEEKTSAQQLVLEQQAKRQYFSQGAGLAEIQADQERLFAAIPSAAAKRDGIMHILSMENVEKVWQEQARRSPDTIDYMMRSGNYTDRILDSDVAYALEQQLHQVLQVQATSDQNKLMMTLVDHAQIAYSPTKDVIQKIGADFSNNRQRAVEPALETQAQQELTPEAQLAAWGVTTEAIANLEKVLSPQNIAAVRADAADEFAALLAHSNLADSVPMLTENYAKSELLQAVQQSTGMNNSSQVVLLLKKMVTEALAQEVTTDPHFDASLSSGTER